MIRSNKYLSENIMLNNNIPVFSFYLEQNIFEPINIKINTINKDWKLNDVVTIKSNIINGKFYILSIKYIIDEVNLILVDNLYYATYKNCFAFYNKNSTEIGNYVLSYSGLSCVLKNQLHVNFVAYNQCALEIINRLCPEGWCINNGKIVNSKLNFDEITNFKVLSTKKQIIQPNVHYDFNLEKLNQYITPEIDYETIIVITSYTPIPLYSYVLYNKKKYYVKKIIFDINQIYPFTGECVDTQPKPKINNNTIPPLRGRITLSDKIIEDKNNQTFVSLSFGPDSILVNVPQLMTYGNHIYHFPLNNTEVLINWEYDNPFIINYLTNAKSDFAYEPTQWIWKQKSHSLTEYNKNPKDNLLLFDSSIDKEYIRLQAAQDMILYTNYRYKNQIKGKENTDVWTDIIEAGNKVTQLQQGNYLEQIKGNREFICDNFILGCDNFTLDIKDTWKINSKNIILESEDSQINIKKLQTDINSLDIKIKKLEGEINKLKATINECQIKSQDITLDTLKLLLKTQQSQWDCTMLKININANMMLSATMAKFDVKTLFQISSNLMINDIKLLMNNITSINLLNGNTIGTTGVFKTGIPF